MLGVHADVTRRTPIGLRTEGAPVMLLGRTGPEFGGSAWAQVTHGHCGGRPPEVDLAAERALADVLTGAAAEGLLEAAHDLSEGGLAVALAECCMDQGLGCQVALPGDLFTQLFSESAARAVVAVRPGSRGPSPRWPHAMGCRSPNSAWPAGTAGRPGQLRHPRR